MDSRHPGSWKPGQSGNPKGRPKRGDTFHDLFEKELKKLSLSYTDEKGTRKIKGKRAIIRAHLAIILSKEVSADTRLRAIDSLYDRIDGRPKQALEHSGPDGSAIIIQFDKDFEGT